MARRKARKSTLRHSKKKLKIPKPKKKNYTWVVPVIGLIIIAAVLFFNRDALIKKDIVTEIEETGEVAAYVNNQPIYLEELENELNRLTPLLPPNQDVEEIRKAVLVQMIDNRILLMEAENAGIEISEEKVDEEINKVLLQNRISIDQLTERLTTLGLTFEEYRNQVRTQIKITSMLNNTIFSDLEVSDEEASGYLEANPSLFKNVRSRHILISTANKTDEEALTLINEIKAKLDENKSKFCEFVEEHSEDPGSKDSCGEYPPENFRRFIKEYQDTTIKNEVGESNIAKSLFGYHLIETLEKTRFSSEEIKSAILFEKQKEKFRIYIANLRSKAEITNCLENPKECREEEEVIEKPEEETTEEELTLEETETETIGASVTIIPLEESNLDSFAKCLTEKGVKMYGAYWCEHCATQKELFGDSVQYITYVECAVENNPRQQTEVCKAEGIASYPTWEINNKKYSGVQTLEKLSQLSGCPL